MKRLILLISMLVFLSVGATSQELSTDSLNTGDPGFPDVGDNFAMPVDVQDIGYMYTLTIYISFDPDVMDYTDYDSASVDTDNITVSFPVDNVIKILVGAFPDSMNVPDGKLLNLNFDFYGGSSDFTFNTFETGSYKSTILQTDASTFYFYDDDVTNGGIFGGEVSNTITGGAWATATNWSLGVVPNDWHNVTVDVPAKRGEVTISADAEANDVEIADGGQLTLNSGNTLTVDEDFTIKSGGSFIQEGTLTVSGTKSAERYIDAADWGDATDGWHFLSSPVQNQAISDGDQFRPSGSGYDFYRWSEQTPDTTWENIKVHNWGSFDEGKGYLVAYQVADTKVFSGDFNTADKSWTGLTRTSDYVWAFGFHLLGNPYPCGLEWGGWTSTNIAGTAKIWNESAKSYTDISSGKDIPAMNGFMVEVEQGQTTGSITIPESKRTHTSTAWYKSDEQRIMLIAHDLDDEGAYQESIIAFNEEATTGYDAEFDSHFFWGYAPGFYSIADGDQYLSTNTLPECNDDVTVPFMFYGNGSENFTIELAETMEEQDVYLKDHKLGNTVNLSETGSYTFTSEAGDDPQRFELMFGVVGIDNPEALSSALIYSNDNIITIANVKGETQMSILNMKGQTVYNVNFVSNGLEEISVEIPTGVYLVRLTNSGAMKTSKVFIK